MSAGKNPAGKCPAGKNPAAKCPSTISSVTQQLSISATNQLSIFQNKTNTTEDCEELIEEDFMDADHKMHEIPDETENSEMPNFSSQTGMRFRLTSRTRSVMGLLEKMFENDLEQNKVKIQSFFDREYDSQSLMSKIVIFTTFYILNYLSTQHAV